MSTFTHYRRRQKKSPSLARLVVMVTICGVVVVCGATSNKTPIYAAGLWPMTGPGWLGGEESLPVIELAVELLNNSTTILPNHEIKLIWNDTQNNPIVAMRQFFHLLQNKPTKLFMIGPCTSRVAEHVSITATAWNLVHISWAARSLVMEDKTNYPYFFRTVPADNAQNPVRLEILKQFGWKKVAIVYQSHDANVYGETMESLGREMLRKNYTILTSEGVAVNDPVRLKLVIARLKQLDARIILGNFFFTLAKDIFCEAYRQGLVWPRHVWIITELAPSWWSYPSETSCTLEEMKDSIKYHIALRTLTRTTTGPFDMSLQRNAVLAEHANCNYCNYAFDAVMAAGTAMHNVHESGLALEDFSYNNPNYSAAFSEELRNLTMNGISGPVGFDEKGNRIGQCLILQAQNDEMVQVGVYDTRTSSLTTRSYADIVWSGGRIPRDGITTTKEHFILPSGLSNSMITMAVLGIAMALSFLAFNIRFRSLKVIKLSSPLMNNVIVLGCVLAYIFVIIYSVETRSTVSLGNAVCTIRLACLSLGFSIAFGAMFSKTWRVYCIMAKKIRPGGVVKMLDIHLARRIMVIVAVDVAFIFTWIFVDPLQLIDVNLSPRIDPNDDDHEITPLLTKCACQHQMYWVGALLVYKGVLLLFGIFLAWETRHISVDALNDSKLTGLCVYNVAVLCTIGVPLGFIIGNENFEGIYAIEALFVIICTTVTLCIVFLPKIHAVYKNPSGEVNLRFQADVNGVVSATGSNRIAPLGLQQLTENITIQRRLENLLAERDRKIKELEAVLAMREDQTAGTSSTTVTS